MLSHLSSIIYIAPGQNELKDGWPQRVHARLVRKVSSHGEGAAGQAPRKDTPSLALALPMTGCVTFGGILHLVCPQLPFTLKTTAVATTTNSLWSLKAC